MRSSFFRGGIRGDDFLQQQVEQVLTVQAADQNAVFGHRDDAGFLADNDNDGIGVFTHAKTGTVAGSHILAHFQVVGQRQHAAGCHDYTVPDDHGAIMQRGTLIENGAQHFGDDIGVHRSAGTDDFFQVVLALQHHQCAGARIGKLFRCIADGHHRALPYPAQRRIGAAVAEQPPGPDRRLAHAFQCTAQFRLKDHHRRRKADGEHVVEYPGHGAQVEHVSQTVENHDQQNTAHQLTGAGFACKLYELVERK